MSQPTAETKNAATRKAAGAPVREPVKAIRSGNNNFILAEARRQQWFCIAEAGTDLHDLHMDAQAFSLVADKLNMMDDIRVLSADGRSFADFTVVDTGGMTAFAVLREFVERPEHQQPVEDLIPTGFTVREVNTGDAAGIAGSGRWLVERDSDKHVLSFGHPLNTRFDAIQFLRNHGSVRKG